MKNNSNNLVNQEIKILVIEDDDNQLIIIQESLRKLGFEVHSTMLGKEGIEMFKSLNNPLILLDYNLPDMNGFDVIDELRREGYNVEFITMTAFGNEHVAVEMMKRGARDYIVKDMNFLDFLPSVVLNTVN
ncbi:MAG TPA: response regulator, partial [Candidatus Kapabacteria bacterium]|nr:response regulator [Candidatus Kapabacteria bacterium]